MVLPVADALCMCACVFACVCVCLQTPEVSYQSAAAFRTLAAGAGIPNGFTFNRSAVLVARALPFGLLPILVPSYAPSFNRYPCSENGAVVIQLQCVEPDNQFMTARISTFPSNGTLFNVNSDGTMGAPVTMVSTFASEVVVSQWVHEVVGFSSEWQSSAAYLESINATMSEVLDGEVPQVCWYCPLITVFEVRS